jgi:N-acetylglucosamine-6-phosphate deacetylase
VPASEDPPAVPPPSVDVTGQVVTGDEIIAAIGAYPGCTAIVTMAAELPDGLALIRALSARGIRVSQGHSGATYDQAVAGYDAGARHATHLFNRMSPLHHRDPGLVGATLERDDVDAEVICDGYHVHPAAASLAIRLKTAGRVVAITDGTGGSGLPVGSVARLGGRPITVGDRAAFLADGTLAGSTLTMDRAFLTLIQALGCSVVEAARMCATNPARTVGLAEHGMLASGAAADVVLLDERWRPVETWVGGTPVWSARRNSPPLIPV